MSEFQLNDWQSNTISRIALQSMIRSKFNHLMPVLSRSNYWLEVGASIILAPRQVGKTTLIKHLEENYFTPDNSFVLYCAGPNRKLFNINSLRGKNINNMTLIVDEFMMLTKEELKELLSFSWANVVLIGSYI